MNNNNQQNRNDSAEDANRKKQAIADLKRVIPRLQEECTDLEIENEEKTEKFLTATGYFKQLKRREDQIFEKISAEYKESIEQLEKEYKDAKKIYDEIAAMQKAEDVEQDAFDAQKSCAKEDLELAELKLKEQKAKKWMALAEATGGVLEEMENNFVSSSFY